MYYISYIVLKYSVLSLLLQYNLFGSYNNSNNMICEYIFCTESNKMTTTMLITIYEKRVQV